MYIVVRYNQPVGFEKFPDIYSARVWCLHNGLAWLKTINKEGDQKIMLYDNVHIEKIS